MSNSHFDTGACWSPNSPKRASGQWLLRGLVQTSPTLASLGAGGVPRQEAGGGCESSGRTTADRAGVPASRARGRVPRPARDDKPLRVAGHRRGLRRARHHPLRQSDRFPEPEPHRELTATPLWMRSTLKGFTVGWRRVPGPAPRPMDGLLASGLDALVKATRADHSNRISPLVSRSGRYPVIQAMTDSVV